MGKRAENASVRLGDGKRGFEGKDDGTRAISNAVKVTIQSIRETTGKQHSDDDILAVYEDCDMDANETVQRLLYLDTFHEVRRKPRKEEQYGGHFRAARNLRVPRRGNVSRNGGYNNRSLFNLNADSTIPPNGSLMLINGKPDADNMAPTSSGIAIADKTKTVARPTQSNRLYSSVVQPENAKLKMSSNNMPSASAPVSENFIFDTFTDLPELDQATRDEATSAFNDDEANLTITDPGKTKPCAQDATLYFISKSVDEKIKDSLSTTTKNPKTSQTTEDYSCLSYDDTLSRTEMDIPPKNSADVAVKTGQVIFPNHLKVPENVKNGLVFGNFDVRAGDKNQYVNGVVDAGIAIDSFDGAEGTCEKTSDVVISVKADHPLSADSDPTSTLPRATVMSCLLDSHKENLNKGTKMPVEGQIPVKEMSANYNVGILPHTQCGGVDSQPQENICLSRVSEIPVPVSASTTPTEQVNLATPPPVIFRPPFHPNFLLYGHYINPYIFPPVHMFLSHNGHPQQTSGPNDLVSPATAVPATKFALPYIKAGPGVVNLSPSLFPMYGAYGSPPGDCNPTSAITAVSPASNRDAIATQPSDANVYTTTCQTECSNWISSTGQELTNLQCNSVYPPSVQGQHLAFVAPVQAAPPPFPVCYQSCQPVTAVPPFPQTIPSQSGWQPSADCQMPQLAPTSSKN